MCGKPMNGDMIQKPKTAYELLMMKRLKECDETVYFTDDNCDTCGKPTITNGKLFWCSDGCIQNGKRGKKDKDGFGFINDLIR